VGEEASTVGRLSILRARMKTDLFPNPNPEQRERVGEAAHRLVELRDGWLNPPGLDPADLAKRTLTNLYNQRPTWLANALADVSDADIVERLLALNLERVRHPNRK
jgi:hypothetical protein